MMSVKEVQAMINIHRTLGRHCRHLIQSLMGSCPGVKPEVTTQSADEQIILVPYERRNEKGKRVRIG